MKVPQCKDPLLTMRADDSTSGWSEQSTFFVCVVQYQNGYHVDIYATFDKQSGGLSVNALSQSIATAIVGDTSQILPRTMKRIHDAVAEVTTETSVVDSYIPDSWKGAFVDEVQSVAAN